MVERQRFEPKRQIPLPNFKPMVDKAKLGDQDAFEEIDGCLRPRLHRYFVTIIKGEADDLVQSTMEKVARDLSKFTPREQDHFSEQFIGWCFVIAKNNLTDEFSRQARLRSTPISHLRSRNNGPDESLMNYYAQISKGFFPDDHDDPEEDSQQEALSLRLRNKLAEILPERQIKIVAMALDGKSNSEIAYELKRSEGSIKTELSHARKKIEQKLIFPAGYKRVAKLWNSRHSTTINQRMNAVKFLRLWYISDEALKKYQAQKAPDQQLLSKGYALLSEVASENEYEYLRTYRPHLLTFRRGRLYILTESLNEFRQTRNKKPSKIVPPEPQYSHISKFSKTARDAARLNSAILTGKLEAIKHNGLWFTTKEEVDKFWQGKLQSPNNTIDISNI